MIRIALRIGPFKSENCVLRGFKAGGMCGRY
jgi:hypothetical protein